MMNPIHLTELFNAQFTGQKICPDILFSKIVNVNTALEVIKTEHLPIRFSFGTPNDDETSLNDWKEIRCVTLDDMTDAEISKQYKVYEVWYDGDDGCIEVMLEVE